MRDFIVIALLLAAASISLAQAPSEQTAALTRAGVQMPAPEIFSDGRVTFRLTAPNATKVEVRGNFPSGYEPTTALLTRGADGIWSVTVGPLKPEFYVYNFLVDGVRVLDPRNPHTTREMTQYSNTLLVPGPESKLLAINDVPHGTVNQVWYDSPALKMKRRAFIYTPPGYETSKSRYPVLYLLHGGAQDEEGWINDGRTPQILDNLIATGQVKPMIVIMPNGYPGQTGSQAYVNRPALPIVRGDMIFAASLVTDLIPFVDKTYQTLNDRNNRAIAGLSMGGGQTLWTAFNHIDRFAWVALFSGAIQNVPGAEIKIDPPLNAAELRPPGITQSFNPDILYAGLPNLTPAGVKSLKLFKDIIGSHDGLVTEHRLFKSTLDARGIPVQYSEVPGYIHEWSFWRYALIDLLPQLFQPAK